MHWFIKHEENKKKTKEFQKNNKLNLSIAAATIK
jgi:hypothetical protein